jgi:hypothetical protein
VNYSWRGAQIKHNVVVVVAEFALPHESATLGRHTKEARRTHTAGTQHNEATRMMMMEMLGIHES